MFLYDRIHSMSISKFLINKKVVKNENQANGLMIVIIALCLLFVIIQNTGGGSNQARELSPEEIELLEERGIDPNSPFPFPEGQI